MGGFWPIRPVGQKIFWATISDIFWYHKNFWTHIFHISWHLQLWKYRNMVKIRENSCSVDKCCILHILGIFLHFKSKKCHEIWKIWVPKFFWYQNISEIVTKKIVWPIGRIGRNPPIVLLQSCFLGYLLI